MKKEYDLTAKIYDPILYPALRAIRKAVMMELSEYRDREILDLCCGTGNQLKLLSRNGFRNLHCLDISESMLEIARKGNYPYHIYRRNALETGFGSETFDIVIISFAIHEKDRNTQEDIIEEAHRILKTGGLLLVVDYVFDDRTACIGKIGVDVIEKFAGREHHRHFRDYLENDGLKSLLVENRFEPAGDRRFAFSTITMSTYHKIAS